MTARARKATASKPKSRDLTMQDLVARSVKGKTLLKRPQDAALFSQGELADAIYFVHTGKVQLTVVSPQDKKAVLATMGPGNFCGEECLVAGARRTSTATTMEPSTVFRIAKRAMLEAIHLKPAVAEEFVTALLARNVDIEEDLCDQLFNHSEQRLACILLKMSRKGQHATQQDVEVPGVTHKELGGNRGDDAGENHSLHAEIQKPWTHRLRRRRRRQSDARTTHRYDFACLTLVSFDKGRKRKWLRQSATSPSISEYLLWITNLKMQRSGQVPCVTLALRNQR